MDLNDETCWLPYSTRKVEVDSSHICRSMEDRIIYPGEGINVQMPLHFGNASHVYISPRHTNSYSWIKPVIMKAKKDGSVEIRNNSSNAVRVIRNEHFANMLPCYTNDVTSEDNMIGRIYDLSDEDYTHLEPSSVSNDENTSFLHDISVDPDHQLPPNWRDKFFQLMF